MSSGPYRALYIHIPFCKSRCSYCDFTTEGVSLEDKRIAPYIEELILSIRRASRSGELGSIETVYIGGGTPTYIGSTHLAGLIYAIATSMHLTVEVECSIEANPESVSEPLIRDIWALGVNRLSLGVQSFDDKTLQLLGRNHSAEDARRALATAQTRFDNISVDLMCGIPGQSIEAFEEGLLEAISLGAKHISVYPLSLEEGTRLEQMVRKGEIEDCDEDVQAEMMQRAASVLESVGMHRYEVASYAVPGYECRHNISYWTGKAYLGMGRSAVSMTQTETSRTRLQDGAIIEELTADQMIAEDLMLAMRMSRGISDAQYAAALKRLPQTKAAFEKLLQMGLVKHGHGRYRPTEKGWLCGNELYGELYSLAP